MIHEVSIGLFVYIAAVPVSTLAQTPVADQPTLQKAQSALDAAEEASRQAKVSADAAQDAARRADGQLTEARRLMSALTTGAPSTSTVAAVTTDPKLLEGCPDASGDIRTLAYFKAVASCEKRVLAGSKVNAFKARSTTGFGTSIIAAQAGASATVTLEGVSNWRSVWNGPMFPRSPDFDQQRIARQRYAFGLRADVGKDDPKFASIATFGELDRLTSKVALFARYGWDYSTAEGFGRNAEGAKASFVQERADALAAQLAADCLKTPGRECSGIDLLRWLFEAKEEGAGKEFANPDAIKLYNAVFWGPPPVDPHPAYGWSTRGELSRPTFDYYPFGLTQVADPFKPGSSKTVIDPAGFPTDFGSRILKESARLNFAATGRAFWHLSSARMRNLTGRHARPLSRFVERTSGTTFIASASFIRVDDLEKPFRDVEVCPPLPANQPFSTNQSCTRLNIAAPVRKDSLVLGAEVRQGIDPFWIVPPMLVSARLTHDLNTNQSGLITPVYFGTDLTGTFTSGVRVAHQWGGRNVDGTNRRAETLVGVVFGVSLGLDGTTGID